MKRKLPIIIFISTLVLLGISGIAHAEMKYTLLESFPGFFTAGTTGPTFPEMILAIYKFGIWTVGIAGLFMLTIGGFWYMTSAGNNATAETAKKIIWDSLLGIVAALAAYLVMYVINPDLTRINIKFVSVSVAPGASTETATTSNIRTTKTALTLTTKAGESVSLPVGTKIDKSTGIATLPDGTTVTLSDDSIAKLSDENSTAASTTGTAGGALPSGTLSDTDARAQLSAAGIGVNKQNCATSTDTDCTSLGGIPAAAITDVISLKNACGCSVTVTGGTEAGHSSHGPGKAKLDLRSDSTLKSFLLQQKNNNALGTYGINQICTTTADADVRYNCNYDEGAAHYHLSFNN